MRGYQSGARNWTLKGQGKLCILLQPILITRLPQGEKKAMSVILVSEDIQTLVPFIYHMINRSRTLNSQGTQYSCNWAKIHPSVNS